MEREDTSGVKASETDSERVDDRDQELPESPAPDPEEKEYPQPEDDPEAD
jgi:hypothetical protein